MASPRFVGVATVVASGRLLRPKVRCTTLRITVLQDVIAFSAGRVPRSFLVSGSSDACVMDWNLSYPRRASCSAAVGRTGEQAVHHAKRRPAVTLDQCKESFATVGERFTGRRSSQPSSTDLSEARRV